MKTRHAHQIRCGIYAARKPELLQYIHTSPRLVREAARREADNIVWRDVRDRLTAWNLRRAKAEQAEHIRRFYA